MDYLYKFILVAFISLSSISCDKEIDNPTDNCVDSNFFSEYSSRSFNMGFSTWAWENTIESVENTYQFISANADIYSEHIDYKIPWNSWINNLPLPTEFTDEITGRVSRIITSNQLTLSVSLLNNSRDDLAADFDGSIPNYTALNDQVIEDAYFKHVQYLVNQFEPDYLIIAIEVNELLKNAPSKWNEYKLLMANVKARIQSVYPTLTISESITLHNLYQVDVQNPDAFINEVVNYANTMDFVAVSFYPFFKGLNTKAGFQDAFDFLHEKINKPIAFAETSHLSEDLAVDSYNLFIEGNECEQKEYLESLLINAQEQNYKYIIWWAHRDYYELWLAFPEELQDLGKLWLSTGIIDDDGTEKKAYNTWSLVLNK